LFLYWTFKQAHCLSSPIKPFTEYESAIELESGTVDLHWTADDEAIVFELHVKTLGWIGLGISPGKKIEFRQNSAFSCL
jgi:hypothetical protein